MSENGQEENGEPQNSQPENGEHENGNPGNGPPENGQLIPPTNPYLPFQKALPYNPGYGYQVLLNFDHQITGCIKENLLELIKSLTDECAKIDEGAVVDSGGAGLCNKREARSGFNVGFELKFWKDWCSLSNSQPSLPVLTAMKNSDFMSQHSKLRYIEKGDVWIFLKADEKEDIEKLFKLIEDWSKLHGYEDGCIGVIKSYNKNEGRILGGQFLDGISNAADAISVKREILVSTPAGVPGAGGTFAFTQLFILDKPVLNEASQPVTENMIGRDSLFSEALIRPQERCHIKRARVISPVDGSNTELIRQSFPFFREEKVVGKDREPMPDGMLFVAFGKSAKRFSDILMNLFGEDEVVCGQKVRFTDDLLLTNVDGVGGKFLYCPSTDEITELPKFTAQDLYPVIPFWFKYQSKNKALFYNHIQYLYTMSTGGYVHGDPPSERILYLMSQMFARWHSTWVHKFDVPRIPHLENFLHTEEEKAIMNEPIQVRKGYSYKIMLAEVFTGGRIVPNSTSGKNYGTSENFGTYRLDPKELIVGITDRLSLGSGKEVMPYLKEGSERTLSYNLALAEDGNMGHIVPGHNYLLELGVSGMLKKLEELKKPVEELVNKSQEDTDKITFYRSAIYAYQGVKEYMLNYAKLANEKLQELTDSSDSDKINLVSIAQRMTKLANQTDASVLTFHDAVQNIFSMHCCLHLCGQQVSVGRLDQLLNPYYQKEKADGTLTEEKAQEIIDAFFIKFDEHVVLNRYNIPYGHTTYGFTCVTGRGGPFPTGDSMNQWIQQVTVGGLKTDGTDACNDVTLMCLKACRRLPLNAPCLSLRLAKSTPKVYRDAAVDAILSGGAHPILYNDMKMVEGLTKVLEESFGHFGLTLPSPEQFARDYSCDGCYEPMFTGRSEFKFAYIFLLKAVIFALNCGADYQPASPLYLVGGTASYRTALPKDIQTFEEFKKIFVTHLTLLVRGLYGLILNSYGNPWLICPSPLMSCLLDGCLDNGRDMTNGGSRFHILTPMYVGFANTVNSLYNIKEMVYGHDDVTSLQNLRMALITNWGENMTEPFYDQTGEGVVHTKMWSKKFKDLRDYALGLPKFGTDSANEEINGIAQWLGKTMQTLAHNCLYEDGPIKDQYEVLREKHSTARTPFLFQVMTGSGTFESYVSVGASCAATPDGRLSGQPTASDVSPQPYPQDRPYPSGAPQLDIVETLKPYNELKLEENIQGAAEVDLSIPEDFPRESLLKFIDDYIDGKTGSNLVTVTCADKETQERARVEPQKFDLLRNRMGGWTNFFVSMPNEHQQQHIRRPIFGPQKAKNNQ